MRYIQDRETHKLLTEKEWYDKYGSDKVQTHFVMPDVEGYVSPVTGLWVDGRVQRKADLINTKSRPWEGLEQEKKEAARQREYQAQKREQEVFKNVEQAFRQLPEQTRRKLGG